MFVITNTDYAEDGVSNVYGPFDTKDAALDRMTKLANAEFEQIEEKFDDAELIDDKPGEIEIFYDEDDGCLYQVLPLEKK